MKSNSHKFESLNSFYDILFSTFFAIAMTRLFSNSDTGLTIKSLFSPCKNPLFLIIPLIIFNVWLYIIFSNFFRSPRELKGITMFYAVLLTVFCMSQLMIDEIVRFFYYPECVSIPAIQYVLWFMVGYFAVIFLLEWIFIKKLPLK
jgi:hypothetical protein